MTQEQKEKLEQKAKDYIKPFAHQLHLGADEGLIMDLVRFAQTILDNPKEWGLMPILESMQHIEDSDSDWKDALSDLKAENERYREALERIVHISKDNGLRGCNWGDTDFDSESVAFGYNMALDYSQELAKEALKKEVNND